MRRAAALIAGGGPAGSAAALLLARGGARPVLIERSREPRDMVCGGFLATGAIEMLARLGVDPASLGAQPISRVRLIAGKRIAEADLPFAAAGLSRRTLDEALLDAATRQGATIERGVAVRRVDPDRLCLHLGDGGTIGADALFLASGKHDLRGIARATGPQADPAIGLRARLDPSPGLAAAIGDQIELHLFRRGYAGLLRLEDGGVNLCLSVAQSLLRRAGGDPAALVAELSRENPLLGERIAAARATSDWLSIARIPYGWRARRTRAGLFRLGDQSAVIASLAGDGIAIALSSAIRAADGFLRGGSDGAPAFQTDFANRVGPPVGVASMLRHMAERPWMAGPAIELLGRLPALSSEVAKMTRIKAG